MKIFVFLKKNLIKIHTKKIYNSQFCNTLIFSDFINYFIKKKSLKYYTKKN